MNAHSNREYYPRVPEEVCKSHGPVCPGHHLEWLDMMIPLIGCDKLSKKEKDSKKLMKSKIKLLSISFSLGRSKNLSPYNTGP